MPYTHNPGHKGLFTYLERVGQADYETCITMLDYQDRETKTSVFAQLKRRGKLVSSNKNGITLYHLPGRARIVKKKQDRIFPDKGDTLGITSIPALVRYLTNLNTQYPGGNYTKLAMTDVIRSAVLNLRQEIEMAVLLLDLLDHPPTEYEWNMFKQQLIETGWLDKKDPLQNKDTLDPERVLTTLTHLQCTRKNDEVGRYINPEPQFDIPETVWKLLIAATETESQSH